MSNKIKSNPTKTIMTITGLVILVCLVAAGVFAWYQYASHADERALVKSLRSTLAQPQTDFTMTTSNKISTAANQTIQNNQVTTGRVDTKQGLTAQAQSDQDTEGLATTRKTSWVVDRTGKVYITLTSFETKFSSKTSKMYSPEAEEKLKMASDLNTKSNTGKWKIAEMLQYTENVYGVDACLLDGYLAVFKTPSLLTKLADEFVSQRALAVEKTDNKYTITPADDEKFYKALKTGGVYKRLATCNPDKYQVANKSAVKNLKWVAETDASGNIKSLDLGEGLIITIKRASNVKVTVPEVYVPPALAEGQTAQEYFEQNMPILYKNLQNAGKNPPTPVNAEQ